MFQNGMLIVCFRTVCSWYASERYVLGMFQNGLFLILPQLSALLVSVPLSYFADVLRRRKILSTVAVRKIFQSIGGL